MKKSMIVNKRISLIIKKNCLYNGSTYEGRVQSSSLIINSNYKVPIIMNEIVPIILFPTTSPRLKNCCWINYQMIYKNTYKNHKNTIYFINGKSYDFDISNNILNNQINKSMRLYLKVLNNPLFY